MVNPLIQLVLTSFIIAVATSASVDTSQDNSLQKVEDFIRTLLGTNKERHLNGERQVREWENPNWSEGSCSRQVLRDTNYNSKERLPDVLPVEPDCGQRQDQSRELMTQYIKRVLGIDLDLDLDKKVVGGTVSEHGEWPWQVAVGTKSFGQFCGGSLIADSWVITAAHCLEEYDSRGDPYLPDKIRPCDYNIRLGEHSLSGGQENHVDITPTEIYVHPNYNSETIRNDIALIKLSEPAPIDENNKINVVCLPGKKDKLRPGRTCQVSGWGDTTGDEDYSDVVMHTNLKIIHKKKCRRLRSYGKYIKPGMLCAGDVKGGPSSCQGDSGGPLVCANNGKYIQAGVVSFGGNICGGAGTPGVYTNVKYYTHWIESLINRKGLN